MISKCVMMEHLQIECTHPLFLLLRVHTHHLGKSAVCSFVHSLHFLFFRNLINFYRSLCASRYTTVHLPFFLWKRLLNKTTTVSCIHSSFNSLPFFFTSFKSFKLYISNKNKPLLRCNMTSCRDHEGLRL